MSNDYTFKLELKVHDSESLYQAAVKRCREDGVPRRVIDDMLLPGGEVQIHNCLAMLLDPGQLAGCNIYCHEVEQLPDLAYNDTEGFGL